MVVMILDPRTVNCHLLARSRLLPGTKAKDPADALASLAVLDAGNLPNAYYSLFLRTEEFDIARFSRALQESSSIARLPGLKGSTQIVPRALLPAVFAASLEPREARAAATLSGWGIGASEYERVREAVLAALGTKEKTLSQLKNGLPPGLSRDIVRTRGRKKERSTNIAVVAAAMRDRWELLRGGVGLVPGEDPGRFSAFGRRFGGMRLDLDYADAVRLLADHYLRAYGPAGAEDLAWWLGKPTAEAAAVLGQAGAEKVQLKGLRGDFFLETGGKVTCGEGLSGSVVLLPADDPFVKAYARRERFVPGPYLKRMITRFGESESIVLVDGVAAGIWHLDQEPVGDVVRVEMFDPVVPEKRAEIESIAATAGLFFTGGDVDVSISVNKK